MPSFDIVSKVDMQEVDNAINQAKKEIAQRYDFKGTKSEIDMKEDAIIVLADDDYKLTAITDIIQSKMLKRSISLKSLDYGKEEPASMGMIRQTITIKQGIATEKAKEINKIIKETKMKVQSQIQGDQVRITAKKIDDLQAVIQLLKGKDLDLDLQFINMRS